MRGGKAAGVGGGSLHSALMILGEICINAAKHWLLFCTLHTLETFA